MEMESLTGALSRLRERGYRPDFAALADGALLCRSCGSTCDPRSAIVHDIVRFEGNTDPGDAAILVARLTAGRRHRELSHRHGTQ